MIYHDTQRLKSDLAWLTQECSLPEFAASRFTAYELTMLQQRVSDVKEKSVRHLFAQLFETFGLKKARWNKKLTQQALPALALIPGEGVRVVITREADGNWKSEGPGGIRSEKAYPPGTLFAALKSQRRDEELRSAGAMFKAVAWQQKPLLFYAAVASLSINILALATSFFSMQVYDRVIPTQGMSTLTVLGVGVFAAIFLEMLLKLSRSHLYDHAARSMDIAYSHDIYHRFLKIRLDALPRSIGTLSGQLQGYATVRGFIVSAVTYVFIDFPFSMIFLAVIIMLAGWMMGLIVVLFLATAILAGLFFRRKIERLTKNSSLASHQKLGLLVESVENAENVKATGAGWSLLGRWNTLTEDAIADDIAIRHYSEMSTYLSVFFQQFSYISLVAMGAYLVSNTETLTMGGLIATTILSGRVLSPIAMLPNLLVQWGRTRIAVEDIDRVYALERDNEGVERPLSPAVLHPRFQCEQLRFGYGENPALQVARLEIAPGERVAILGMIGSGKSTLLKLLCGLYKPQQGQVLIDGIDMHHLSRNRLNETLGYLPQNVRLISGSLRDNLLLGLAGIDDAAIMEAARMSGAIALINALPQGLDTTIPEGGESVSGGQKQMIALTRLLLMEPRAWLLDEPTANMDDRSERQLLEAIEQKLTPEQTLILVTHKPALLRLVERIIVLTPQGIAMDGPKEAVLQKLNPASQARKDGGQ